MRKIKYKYLFAISYSVFLTILSIYVILDTLIFSEVYTKIDNSNAKNSNIKKEVTSNSYQDENIIIKIKTYQKYETNIYVADITLSDISYLRTAFAKDSYGKNITEKTSEIAKRNNAVLAINGDYYGVQEKGFVLKNGVIYRSIKRSSEDLVIYDDGMFEIINEDNYKLKDLLSFGAYQVLSFGPALINDYNVIVSKETEVGKAMASNPRTAIGFISKLHYVFVVSDGRTKESKGLSLYELASFMKELDIKIAYNLDGGGSSTMYFNGNVINNPTTNGKIIKERSVSDIVYVGY